MHENKKRSFDIIFHSVLHDFNSSGTVESACDNEVLI